VIATLEARKQLSDRSAQTAMSLSDDPVCAGSKNQPFVPLAPILVPLAPRIVERRKPSR